MYEFGIVSKESEATQYKYVKYNNANCYGCNDVSRTLNFILEKCGKT